MLSINPLLSSDRPAWRIGIWFLVLAGTLGLSTDLTPKALSEPALSTCAIPSISVSGLTLLLDPVGRTPVALLSSAGLNLTQNRAMVLQTFWSDPEAAGLPHLQLSDVLPEFWAQPGSLRPFLKGPGAYSGEGIEVRTRDWAGLPATDRRAYRLDPGLRQEPTAESTTTPHGGGTIVAQRAPGAVRLTWSGIAGRIYEVQTTTRLDRAFERLQTFIPSQDGPMEITLPTAASQGFYRIAEIIP